ncbi:hypothetical protein LOK49_Contig325G00001, partial [Camellia lanceoleosa]
MIHHWNILSIIICLMVLIWYLCCCNKSLEALSVGASKSIQLCKKAHTVPNLSPDKVSKLDLHEGEWGDHGSIKVWTYVTGFPKFPILKYLGGDSVSGEAVH